MRTLDLRIIAGVSVVVIGCFCWASAPGAAPRSSLELANRFRAAVMARDNAGIVSLVWGGGLVCGDTAISRKDLEGELRSGSGPYHVMLFDTSARRAFFKREGGVNTNAYAFEEWFRRASNDAVTEVMGDDQSGVIKWSSKRLRSIEEPPAVEFLREESGAYVIVHFGPC